MLIDTHTHIQFDAFDNDRYEVIKRARQVGVGAMIAVGVDEVSSRSACELAREYDDIYATVGVHPNSASGDTPEILAMCRELLQYQKVVAIGEVGLDYYHDRVARDHQREVFEEFCQLADEYNVPMVMHAREAYDDFLNILEHVHVSSPARGVAHCFSGTEHDLDRLLAMDLYVSFCGNITYPKAVALRKLAEAVPLEKLLLETDTPYLAPQSVRGKRNEPAYVCDVATAIADIKKVDLQQIIERTTANAINLFSITEKNKGDDIG